MKSQSCYSDNIISMLCKDAPYAWFLFDQAKQNSRYKLVDFQHQASQLEAYLDAFGVALNDGYPVEKWLEPADWGSCFVLAVLGIRYNKSALFDAALDNLNEEEETHYREIVDACLWDKKSNSTIWFAKLLEHSSPVAQQSAVAISRSSRQGMPQYIFKFFSENKNSAVCSQFLNWLAEQGSDDDLPYIQSNYKHEDLAVSFSAARAGFLRGDITGRIHLERFALVENKFMLDAITLLFIKEGNQNTIKAWINKLWETESISIRVKLYAIAIAGFPEMIDRIFQPMVDEETSRAAGEVFSIITGADIEFNDLDASDDDCTDCQKDKANEKDQTLAEKREADPFISDWEEDLPYPCPDVTQGWWQMKRGDFANGTQYLAGLETTEDNLKAVLKKGNQRQRHLAALHLFIKHGYPWLDCGWPPTKQFAKS